jgi:hypothetical protein
MVCLIARNCGMSVMYAINKEAPPGHIR